jgi:hypothetical protein
VIASPATGGASNVTLAVVVLTEDALATLKPALPMKLALAVVSGSPSLARVTFATVIVYDAPAVCTDVVIVTLLPLSTGVPLSVSVPAVIM